MWLIKIYVFFYWLIPQILTEVLQCGRHHGRHWQRHTGIFLKYFSRFLCLLLTDHLVTVSHNLAYFTMICTIITPINYILKRHILVAYSNVCVYVLTIPTLAKVFVYYLLFKIPYSPSSYDTSPLDNSFIDSFSSQAIMHRTSPDPHFFIIKLYVCSNIQCPSRSHLILLLQLSLPLSPSCRNPSACLTLLYLSYLHMSVLFLLN